MTNSFLSGPTPPYNNLSINPQYYKPSKFFISDITLGQTTTVTTTVDMNYVIGQEVRLLTPSSFGCYQLNEVSGYVISLPASNQVELSIDSSQNVDPFFSGSVSTTLPQIVAIGDINSGNISNTGNINLNTNIPGSFINISPL